LRWLVDGAVVYYEADRREGERPRSVVEGTAEWREEIDLLAPIFEAGYLERTQANVWTPTMNLYAAYQEFANQDNGTRVPLQYRMGDATFGKRLAEQFAAARRTVEIADGKKQLKGYYGVKAGRAAGETLCGSSWVSTDNGGMSLWETP
jgi:hypothetical protein